MINFHISRKVFANLFTQRARRKKCKINQHFALNFGEICSLRSRRYSRAQGGKLEIPPAQKLSILSSPAAG